MRSGIMLAALCAAQVFGADAPVLIRDATILTVTNGTVKTTMASHLRRAQMDFAISTPEPLRTVSSCIQVPSRCGGYGTRTMSPGCR